MARSQTPFFKDSESKETYQADRLVYHKEVHWYLHFLYCFDYRYCDSL